jgi:hypothetical protein
VDRTRLRLFSAPTVCWRELPQRQAPIRRVENGSRIFGVPQPGELRNPPFKKVVIRRERTLCASRKCPAHLGTIAAPMLLRHDSVAVVRWQPGSAPSGAHVPLRPNALMEPSQFYTIRLPNAPLFSWKCLQNLRILLKGGLQEGSSIRKWQASVRRYPRTALRNAEALRP